MMWTISERCRFVVLWLIYIAPIIIDYYCYDHYMQVPFVCEVLGSVHYKFLTCQRTILVMMASLKNLTVRLMNWM